MTCTRELLLESASHVLETAAFMTAEPVEPAPDGRERAGLEASVAFGGPLAGTLRAAAPRELAVALAAAQLGCEPSEPEAAQSAQDALGELVNVLAGVLAGKLLGPARACPLGTPQVSPDAAPASAGALRLDLCVDDLYPLRLTTDVAERAALEEQPR